MKRYLVYAFCLVAFATSYTGADMLLIGAGSSGPGGAAASFSDDFNRANGGVGANYTEHENAMLVDTNEFDSATVGKAWSTVASGTQTFTSDHSANIQMNTSDSFDRAGVGVRGTSTCGYVCYANATNLVIDEYSGSSTWAFGAQQAHGETITTGTYCIDIDATGTTITCKLMSSDCSTTTYQTTTYVDSTCAAGAPGIYYELGSSAGAKGDDFVTVGGS